MGYLFEALLVPLLALMKTVVVFVITTVVKPLTASDDLFRVYFSAIDQFQIYIYGAAILIAVGIFVFQVFRRMFYNAASTKTDNIGLMGLKLVLAIALILSTSYIRSFALGFSTLPFKMPGATDYFQTYEDETVIGNSFNVMQDQINLSLSDLAGADDTLANRIIYTNGDNTIRTVTAFIEAILLLPLGLSYILFCFKVLLRYVLLMVLLYLMPFAFATLPSESTSKVFTKYMELLVSSMILFFLDMLFMKLLIHSLCYAFSSEIINNSTIHANALLSVALLMGLAATASIVDEHMASLLSTINGTRRFSGEIAFYAQRTVSTEKAIRGDVADYYYKKYQVAELNDPGNAKNLLYKDRSYAIAHPVKALYKGLKNSTGQRTSNVQDNLKQSVRLTGLENNSTGFSDGTFTQTQAKTEVQNHNNVESEVNYPSPKASGLSDQYLTNEQNQGNPKT